MGEYINENITHLFYLSNNGDLIDWFIPKQQNMTLKYSWHQVSRFSYIIRQVLSLKKMFVPLKKKIIVFCFYFSSQLSIFYIYIHNYRINTFKIYVLFFPLYICHLLRSWFTRNNVSLTSNNNQKNMTSSASYNFNRGWK